MKRHVLQAVMMLGLCAPVWGAITHVTDCTAVGTTSCTLATTPKFNDLMIATCGDTTTACAVPTGWVSILSTTATRSLRSYYKFALGNEGALTGFTTGTGMFVDVYRGAGIVLAGPFGGTSTATGTSTTISYNTITMTHTDGSSWVVGCAWSNGATAADVAPSGMTLRSGTGTPAFACSDTNGGVASWSTTTVTTINATSVAWRSNVIELVSDPAATAISNYLVSQTYTAPSGEACTGVCDFTIPVMTNGGSGANNLLMIALMWGYASTAPTISNVYCNADTGHATWTWTVFPHPVLDTGDTTDATLYYIPGAAAGCKSVTVVYGTVFNNVVGKYTEWRQIATSSPLDTSAGQTATGAPNVTAGSITPSSSGDLIYQLCSAESILTTGFNNSTGIFAGSGATLLSPDISFAIADEAFIQTTAGAITPYISIRGLGSDAVCVSVAMKASAGAGTAPSGLNIISYQDFTTGASTTSPVMEAAILNAGDTFLIAGNSGVVNTALNQLATVSDVLSSSWTIKQTATGAPAWMYDCSAATAGSDYITMTGTAANNQIWTMLELSGTNNTSHTSCFDSTMGLVATTGAGTPYTSAPTGVTPSAAGGLVLGQFLIGNGPTTAITSPACAVFWYPTYTGQTDLSFMTEGGGLSACYSTTTSTQSYTWTAPNNASWGASVIGLLTTQSLSPFTGSLMMMGMGK